MTDWKAAGELADAHRVTRLLSSQFDTIAKHRVRNDVARFFRTAKADRVLDGWGGGASAKLMTEAGLTVLSVDDGRAFASEGVTKPRG